MRKDSLAKEPRFPVSERFLRAPLKAARASRSLFHP